MTEPLTRIAQAIESVAEELASKNRDLAAECVRLTADNAENDERMKTAAANMLVQIDLRKAAEAEASTIGGCLQASVAVVRLAASVRHFRDGFECCAVPGNHAALAREDTSVEDDGIGTESDV